MTQEDRRREDQRTAAAVAATERERDELIDILMDLWRHRDAETQDELQRLSKAWRRVYEALFDPSGRTTELVLPAEKAT